MRTSAARIETKRPRTPLLGLDLGFYELSKPLFWRSVFAELVATTMFLFFAIATVVYRGLFGLGTQSGTQLTSNNYGGAARSGIAFGFGFR